MNKNDKKRFSKYVQELKNLEKKPYSKDELEEAFGEVGNMGSVLETLLKRGHLVRYGSNYMPR
ncbi:MAG: hypothetical protein JW700_00740 [Candidatus Aenigmarchaeota archaeon]|nr:hypothetical protein [Candidatus Aenigmarchaeota archaeon]